MRMEDVDQILGSLTANWQEYEQKKREEEEHADEALINRMIQMGEKARMPAEQAEGRKIRL